MGHKFICCIPFRKFYPSLLGVLFIWAIQSFSFSSPSLAAYSWNESVARNTSINAGHFNELKGNIDAQINACGKAAYAWPGGIYPVSAGNPILSSHINALRGAVKYLYGAGHVFNNSIDQTASAADTILAVHITDLRTAVDNPAIPGCGG